jgi:hypothetical protein
MEKCLVFVLGMAIFFSTELSAYPTAYVCTEKSHVYRSGVTDKWSQILNPGNIIEATTDESGWLTFYVRRKKYHVALDYMVKLADVVAMQEKLLTLLTQIEIKTRKHMEYSENASKYGPRTGIISGSYMDGTVYIPGDHRWAIMASETAAQMLELEREYKRLKRKWNKLMGSAASAKLRWVGRKPG